MRQQSHRESAELARPQAAESLETSKLISLLTAEFLTPADVAALLKVSRWTLADWRLKGQGPPFLLKARGVVVYSAESFIKYLRAQPQKDCRERTGARCSAN
jgi:hypothetical protein